MTFVAAKDVFKTTAGKIILLATLYMIAGKLGLMMALPPGYSTIIWPASGIATGFLLINGWRMWPGIFIGSFLLNCMATKGISAFFPENFDISQILIAAIIAIGSTLQAIAAYALIKRYLSIPLKLEKFSDIGWLFFLTGPLACLIAPTIGNATLYFGGTIPLAELQHSWLTWWMGDMFGVLVFLPLMIVMPGGLLRIKWKNRSLGTLPILSLLILMIPLGLTFYMWKVSSQYIYDKNHANFEILAKESEKALLNRTVTYYQILLGAAGFINGSEDVSEEEWRRYAEIVDAPSRLPGIRGIGYVEFVQPEKIDQFTRAMKRQNPDYEIWPETKRREYFISKFFEPHTLPRRPGLNLAFEDSRYEAATKARDTGLPVITKYIQFVNGQNEREKLTGFNMMYPVYGGDAKPETQEARRASIRGWILTPLLAKEFLMELTQSQNFTINLQVYDGYEELPVHMIYDSHNEPGAVQSLKTPLFKVVKHIEIMQRHWTLVWTSTPVFERGVNSKQPLVIGIGGLFFSGLFAAFLMMLAYREKAVQRQVEEKTLEVSANEERLRLLIKNTPAAVAMFDTDMRYIMMSDRWAEDYRLERQDVIGKSHYEIFPEIKEMPHWIGLHQRALSGETLSKEEDSWRRADGRTEWVKWALHPWTNSEGKTGGIVMFTEVITDRKKSEVRSQLLREITIDASEIDDVETLTASVLQNICSSMGWPLGHAYVFNDKSQQLESSHIWYYEDSGENYAEFRKVSGMFTYKPGIGLPGRVYQDKKPIYIRDIATENNFPRNQVLSQQLLHTALGIPVIVNDRVEIVLEFFSPFMIDEKTIPRSFYEMLSLQLSRVIERSKVKRALEESRLLNEAILSSTKYLLIATDRQGDVLVFNNQAEKMMGYGAQEVIGHRIPRKWLLDQEFMDRYETLRQEFGDQIRPNFDVFSTRAMRDGVDVKEWTFVRKNGTTFPVRLSVTPIRDKNNSIVGFLGVGEDITEIKEIERMKSEFISIVSHELRTPLTSIRGSLGLIEGVMSKDLPEKVNNLISLAHKNSERLIHLINDILDLDKMAAGQMRFDMKEEDFSALVTQAVESNAGFAEKYKVHFSLEKLPENIKVCADGGRFIQVVTNMLSNAAKFSPENDSVTVSATVKSGWVRLSVKDNGPGIPEEFKTRIFGKFTQADSSATRKKGGTGLGLHISKEMIERMNGRMGFDSEVGKGSNFWVELPLLQDDLPHITFSNKE